MDEIVTEHTGSILRIQFNRPKKRNAMTSAMYVALAEALDAPLVTCDGPLGAAPGVAARVEVIR